jgi:hypothetical protein
MISLFQRRHRYARGLDWACSAMIAAWGGLLALPGDTFANSPSLALVAERFPESQWAVGLILLGLIRIAALIVNGRLPQGSPAARGIGAALSAVVWSQFFVASLDASIRDGVALPGIGVNLVLLGCEMVTVVRSTRDFVRARDCRGDG